MLTNTPFNYVTCVLVFKNNLNRGKMSPREDILLSHNYKELEGSVKSLNS